MATRRRSKGKRTDSEDEYDAPNSVIFLSSSDDEHANEDLSLEIVEKSMRREVKRKRGEDREIAGAVQASVIDLSSASSDEIVATSVKNADGGGRLVTAVAEEEEEKGKRKKKSKKKKKKSGENAAVPPLGEEPLKKELMEHEPLENEPLEKEPLGTADSIVTELADSMVTELNEASDNAVLRKLLRGPRYFDLGDKTWQTCYNCGEEGHNAVNCTMEKRQKPCFVCGMFGHNAKLCTQSQNCFICKRRGHIAKDCPDKHKQSSQDSIICLRCGELGHDMLFCQNSYPPDDLKEIQCYICKKYGHLCCVDFMDTAAREISCYNCAQPGHTGLGCAKQRGETSADVTPTVCYRCGEEGHFARGCTQVNKSRQWMGESSTPTQRYAKGNRDVMGFRSLPHDFGKHHKKKGKFVQYEDRWNMSGGKSRIKGGWSVDDPGDLSFKRKAKSNGWTSSPRTPARKSQKVYSSPGRHYSNSESSHKNHKSFIGTPSSHGFSASRFSNSQARFRIP